jgi:hypothetical protein
MKIGPTKVTAQGDAIYDAKSGKLVHAGLSTPQAVADYALHHYIALPVVDNQGRVWNFEGKAVYCLRGAQYETVDDELPHVRRCSECGGMAVPSDEVTVERDCVRCTHCGHEFDARLEMMES